MQPVPETTEEAVCTEEVQTSGESAEETSANETRGPDETQENETTASSVVSGTGFIFRCGKKQRSFVVQFFFKAVKRPRMRKTPLFKLCNRLKLIFGHSVNFHTLLIFPLQN